MVEAARGAWGICSLPALGTQKVGVEMKLQERYQEARREERDQVVVDARIRKYCVAEVPGGSESPQLFWEGQDSLP